MTLPHPLRPTERLAERETLLYSLGSELNRTVSNSCGNPIIRSAKTRDFSGARFFCEQSHSHQKSSQKRKLSIFGNTKQVIQDYDTVFDNSIPFRKNDLLRITVRISEYRACQACTLCLGTEAVGRVARRSGPAQALAPFPCRGAAPCGLCLVAGGGGWCCCGVATHAPWSVAACNRRAALIDVRLDVGSLAPRSSSPTVAGCQLGGFPVGRDQ